MPGTGGSGTGGPGTGGPGTGARLGSTARADSAISTDGDSMGELSTNSAERSAEKQAENAPALAWSGPLASSAHISVRSFKYCINSV